MASLSRSFVLRTEENAKALYSFLKANWKALAASGKPLVVQVGEYKARRSTQANKRYWAILNQISGDAWIEGKQFSADIWHEWSKRRFIGCHELPDGSLVGISTTTLDVAEFNDYMSKIESYAAQELGVEFLL